MPRTGRPRTAADVEKKCEYCGVVFIVREWEIRKNQPKKYCSRECYRLGRIGKPHPKHNVPPLEKTCINCGKTFLTGGRGRPKRHATACSIKCANQAKQIHDHIKTLGTEDVCWLAGFFDGEGNIAFTHKAARAGLRLTIVNTSTEGMERVRDSTGTGKLILRERNKKNSNHQDIWVWSCYGENARSLLRQMLPHLTVKKSQALYALAEN